MIIQLDKVSLSVQQIIICASICKYPNDNKKDRRTLDQNFGMVDDCYVRLIDDGNGNELARYELNETFRNEDALQFARLYRMASGWEFQALGHAMTGSLGALVDLYT
jgi:tellurium resistance protein TerD